MTPEEVLVVLNEVKRAPAFHLVAETVGYEWVFAMNHLPGETTTDEDPPVRIDEKTEVIEIDGLLGLYEPSKQLITIFKKGISYVAKLLDVREASLEYVVRLHEWGHALLHVGLSERDRVEVARDESSWIGHLTELTLAFEVIDHEINEALAQLITFYVIQDLKRHASHPKSHDALDRIGEAFQKLMGRAPRIYDITNYLDVRKQKILKSVRFIRNRSIIGFETWDTVLRW